MDKAELTKLLRGYNWWMGASTIAVAIGILGEYVAHFVFEKEARRNKIELAVSILFGVLVLGGVVGEYIFGEKLAQAADNLQQLSDAEVAQANKEAAIARRDAAQAQRDLAQLQKATLPRTLDPVRVASKIGGFGRINVAPCSLADFEPAHTISLITIALRNAGWIENDNIPIPVGFGGDANNELNSPGVWIEVSPPAETVSSTSGEELSRLNRAANALASALAAEGLEAKRRPLTHSTGTPMLCSTNPDSVRIIVGLRPMPGMPDLLLKNPSVSTNSKQTSVRSERR